MEVSPNFECFKDGDQFSIIFAVVVFDGIDDLVLPLVVSSSPTVRLRRASFDDFTFSMRLHNDFEGIVDSAIDFLRVIRLFDCM